jgi:hypothetical protein
MPAVIVADLMCIRSILRMMRASARKTMRCDRLVRLCLVDRPAEMDQIVPLVTMALSFVSGLEGRITANSINGWEGT